MEFNRETFVKNMRPFARQLLGLAMAASIAACAAEQSDPPRPPRLVSTEFDPDIMLIGYNVTEDLVIDGTANVRLRTNIDRTTHADHYQVYIVLWYSGKVWQIFTTATDVKRHALQVIQVGRTPGRCMMSLCSNIETIAALIPTKDLRAAASTGYQLQIRSKGGDAELITLTPEQIKAQLLAVDPLVAG